MNEAASGEGFSTMTLTTIGVILVLLIFSAFFSGSETALTPSRPASPEL